MHCKPFPTRTTVFFYTDISFFNVSRWKHCYPSSHIFVCILPGLWRVSMKVGEGKIQVSYCHTFHALWTNLQTLSASGNAHSIYKVFQIWPGLIFFLNHNCQTLTCTSVLNVFPSAVNTFFPAFWKHPDALFKKRLVVGGLFTHKSVPVIFEPHCITYFTINLLPYFGTIVIHRELRTLLFKRRAIQQFRRDHNIKWTS
jgi:hypothetical protein